MKQSWIPKISIYALPSFQLAKSNEIYKYYSFKINYFRGHEDVCQILITAGADINQVDDNEDTSLHYASREGHKRILEILLRKPSLQINKKNTLGLEAYQLSSNEEIVKSF